MERELETFEVETSSGDRYTLVLVQEMVAVRPLSGPAKYINGMRRYDVLGGGHANYKDGVDFEIVHTGEIARRV